MADYNVDDKIKQGAETAKSETLTAFELWQHNASRVMRANERVIHGIITTTKLQLQLGQDVLNHRLGNLPSGNGETKVRGLMERQTAEIEKLVNAVRAVSEELRTTFSEASQLLFEDADKDAKTAFDSASNLVKSGHEITASVTSKAAQKASSKIDHD